MSVHSIIVCVAFLIIINLIQLMHVLWNPETIYLKHFLNFPPNNANFKCTFHYNTSDLKLFFTIIMHPA